MCFTGFYWVLLGFTGFYTFRALTNVFYWVLPDFTGFYPFRALANVFSSVLLGSTRFYRVSLGFTGFYRVFTVIVFAISQVLSPMYFSNESPSLFARNEHSAVSFFYSRDSATRPEPLPSIEAAPPIRRPTNE